MAGQDKTAGVAEYAPDTETDKYPLLVRIFGAVSIIAGAVQVVAFVLMLLAVFFGKIDFTNLEPHATTTLVIGLISLALSAALSVLFILLGVRLLRGMRHKVALISSLMIALEAVVLVCHFMLTGSNL